MTNSAELKREEKVASDKNFASTVPNAPSLKSVLKISDLAIVATI